mmetsp:Transcript_9521/g.15603  ORF Transcript_9521/g.15603 Transcript_9521/m.15603 type:complete len:122 (+) Transcript_9521:201-566(+)
MALENSDGQVKLRFIFANQDGVSVEANFKPTETSDAIKQRLLEKWPENVDKVDDVRRLRIICMGKEIEHSSTKTIQAFKIPSYDHPTPVNVCVLPKAVEIPATEKTVGSSSKPVKGCCVVM